MKTKNTLCHGQSNFPRVRIHLKLSLKGFFIILMALEKILQQKLLNKMGRALLQQRTL